MTSIKVYVDNSIGTINKNIYGHFAEHLGSCIYEGIWVGENSPIPNTNGIRNDVVEALRAIAPPIIRWPGGCFADDYHWQDGIGPRESRPSRLNIWWGEDVETNHFGTHEFIQLCRMVGAEPYLVGNVGSGTPQELRNWVEYCNVPGNTTLSEQRAANGSPEPFGVKYWGVGNENWGCGGRFEPEDYAVEYRRFSTYLRDFGGSSLFLIACGPLQGEPIWTRHFFEKLGDYPRIHGFGAHYYARIRDPLGTPVSEMFTGTSTEYSASQWYYQLLLGLEMENLVLQQRATMDSYDPQRKIGLIFDEWGTWHPPAEGHHPRHLWQQNTMRDALVAATTLDIFNRHADKVIMSNIAQTVNVLQAMILTNGDRMLKTPTYHVYDMYQVHQNATSVLTSIDCDDIGFSIKGSDHAVPTLAGSASLKSGVLTLSVVNLHADTPIDANIEINGANVKEVSYQILANDDIHAHNTFDEPNHVVPQPSSVVVNDDNWTFSFRPASVNVFRIRL